MKVTGAAQKLSNPQGPLMDREVKSMARPVRLGAEPSGGCVVAHLARYWAGPVTMHQSVPFLSINVAISARSVINLADPNI
jgi:hypothetical protein